MNARLLSLPCLLAVLACATPKPSTPAASPAPSAAATTAKPAGPAPEEVVAKARQLEADTTLTSPSGATYQVAKGWYVTERAELTVLEDPERELILAMVESQAPTGEAAIAEGWKRLRPDFARKELQTVRPPIKDRFSEAVQVVYETANEESRGVMAIARKHKDTWFVSLIDGPYAALGRRGAQLNTVVTTLTPAGATEESLAGRPAKRIEGERLAELEKFIEASRTAAEVPGLSVVLVQDGRIVYERGFGEREQGTGKPVTPDTLFLIGSVSKSLTSLMMAKLVDEGRLQWDSKVSELMPSFALGDAAATEQLQLRHTVCACTGLPRQDMEFLFDFAGVTPDQRLASMKSMKPTTGFGETFQYSNLLVSAGGYIAARSLEKTAPLNTAYSRVMQRTVFGPLGMSKTTFDFDLAKKSVIAMPHGLDHEMKPRKMPLSYEIAVQSVAPAGGFWSSGRDLARYVQLELAKGALPDGKRYVAEAPLLERRKPMARIHEKAFYGLGLFVEEDRKLQVVGHGGNTLGFSADVFFIPEANVGAIVLTNAQAANGLTRAIRGRLIELWFDAQPRAAEQFAFGVKTRHERAAKENERIEPKPEAAWSRQFLGSYKNADLGVLTLREDGGRFLVDAGEWQSAYGMRTDPAGAKSVVLLDAPLAGLEFYPQPDGGLMLETDQQKYVFARAK